MARELREIIFHLRAVSANPAVSTTLIQTEDLLLLCDAAERTLNPAPDSVPPANPK